MIGKIDAVRGTVIEVEFQDRLPAIGGALHCQVATDQWLTAVVHSHIGGRKVQAIALDSTRGMRRGSMVESDGTSTRASRSKRATATKAALAGISEGVWPRVYVLLLLALNPARIFSLVIGCSRIRTPHAL
jgi:hypothetical protein